MNLHLPLFERIVNETRAGRRVVLCVVTKTRGSTPQSPGAMLVVDEAMQTLGTLGGGCVEAEIRKRAFAMLERDASGLLSFQLNHDYGWDDGLICGGGMDVAVAPISGSDVAERFAEIARQVQAGQSAELTLCVDEQGGRAEYRVVLESEPKLVIAGAGHIGAYLARMCVDLEFDVTVIDDRSDFANPQRLPPPIHVVVGDIEQSLRDHPIDQNTYCVIVTRGHNHDEQALGAVIDTKARYIGMIGSRRKVKLIFDDLATAGVDASKLKRVHSPIGLSINAVTVPEIAVSIAAELIAERRKDRRKIVEGPILHGAKA